MTEEWMSRSACRGEDPEWWFPFSTMSTEAREALAICKKCEVRGDCFQYARRNKETTGIWGGKFFGTRTRIARGSDEEEVIKDAVVKALESGWSIHKTAKYLRVPYNMVLRLSKDEPEQPLQVAADEPEEEEESKPELVGAFSALLRKVLRVEQ